MSARLVVFALLLVAAVIVPRPAQAQAQWEMLLLVQNGVDDVLMTVNHEGIAAVEPVPAGLYADGKDVIELVISEDRRYLAANLNDYTPGGAEIRIADLEAGTCCVSVALQADAFDLGTFGPGTEGLAISYIGAPALDAEGRGGIATVDHTTGDVLSVLTMRDYDAFDPDQSFPAPWAYMGDWTPDGIHFMPTCYACEPPFEGEFARWRPDEGSVSIDTGVTFSWFGQGLSWTGERVEIVFDERFPFVDEPGFFPPHNVVYYLPEGGLASQGAGVPVFSSTGMPKLESVHFVNDGAALLIDSATDESRARITRGGFSMEFAVEPSNRVLAGTPNGWVEMLIHDDGTPALRLIGEALADDIRLEGYDLHTIVVLDAPELGRTIDPFESPFTEIVPPG